MSTTPAGRNGRPTPDHGVPGEGSRGRPVPTSLPRGHGAPLSSPVWWRWIASSICPGRCARAGRSTRDDYRRPERPPDRRAALRRCALAPYWVVGNRNAAAGALAGGLLPGGWAIEAVEHFIEAVAAAADDEELLKRIGRVAETAQALKAGEKVTGFPALARTLGADGEDVVRQLRLMLGLTINLAALAADKHLPVEFLKSLGLHDLPKGGVGVPYKDGSGRPVAVKERTALMATDGSYWPKGQLPMAYGEERLDEATAAGYRVIVEGENDCWTLWFHHFPVVGLPGSNTVPRTLDLGHVAGVKRLFVVQEPDGGGAEFVRAVAARLAELGWVGELRVLRLDGHKDPNDLHCATPKRSRHASRLHCRRPRCSPWFSARA